jgi:hypothetical protein
MMADNDRYTFSCAWGNSGSYRTHRISLSPTISAARSSIAITATGLSRSFSRTRPVWRAWEQGMGCSWCDYDNDGHAGHLCPEHVGGRWDKESRIAETISSKTHRRGSASSTRASCPRVMLSIRNQGDRQLRERGAAGRRGNGPLVVVVGLSGTLITTVSPISTLPTAISPVPDRDDLASFFWRQIVVAESPEDATPSVRYERGWNAINELIRSDHVRGTDIARNVSFPEPGKWIIR